MSRTSSAISATLREHLFHSHHLTHKHRRLRGMDGSGFQPSILFFVRCPRPMAWAGMVPGRCPSNTAIHAKRVQSTNTTKVHGDPHSFSGRQHGPPSRGFRTLPGIPIPIRFPGVNTQTPHTGARPKRIFSPGVKTATTNAFVFGIQHGPPSRGFRTLPGTKRRVTTPAQPFLRAPTRPQPRQKPFFERQRRVPIPARGIAPGQRNNPHNP